MDDGRAFRTLHILDEYSRECLAIRVRRELNSANVIDALSDLFILRGVPTFRRSDNGPEFVVEAVQKWIKVVGSKTAYIEPGSPWENGRIESFNARLLDELLKGEIFNSLNEAKIIIEQLDYRAHASPFRCTFRVVPGLGGGVTVERDGDLLIRRPVLFEQRADGVPQPMEGEAGTQFACGLKRTDELQDVGPKSALCLRPATAVGATTPMPQLVRS